MTAQPSSDGYTAPFVSENVGPPPFDDCLPAAGLMALANWTFGEVLLNDDWTVKNEAQRTALRERMRNTLPANKQNGNLSTADLETMKEALWPYLPHVPFYDATSELRSWDGVLNLLRSGEWGGLALGNPSRVKDQHSTLRTYTRNDDYGHFIWLERANASTVLVWNPLAKYDGYEGDHVAYQDIRQFLNTDSRGNVAVGMYKRGDQSTQAIVARGLREDIAVQRALVAKVGKNLSDANNAIAKLQQQINDTPPPTDCTAQVATAVAPYIAKISAAQAALA